MPVARTYAIFWLPRGTHFEPRGSDASFESLVIRFLRDVGDTRFYGLLAQYSRSPRGKIVKNGPIRNVSTFGGSYFDTTPYDKAATKQDPLLDADFLDEVNHVADREHWTLDATSLVFVFIGAGAKSCAAIPCTRTTEPCGYHIGTEFGPMRVILEDAYTNGCTLPFARLPNRDIAADSEINSMSHELFEAVTDPVPCQGWITRCGYDRPGLEIGDVCEYRFGRRNPDGSNVVLHDHTYLLQQEWSNRDGKCVVLSSRFPPPRPAPAGSCGIPLGAVI
ncbi:MAG: hypothetical protein JOZ41_14330, partial [Chloroflexi bacterium]|nr:hypothetical protein [Chloroflexota bacterium]